MCYYNSFVGNLKISSINFKQCPRFYGNKDSKYALKTLYTDMENNFWKRALILTVRELNIGMDGYLH
jgi:hypothetical protein